MAGDPGCEFFGPWDDGPAVKEAILEADRTRPAPVGSSHTSRTLWSWLDPTAPAAIFTATSCARSVEWLRRPQRGDLGSRRQLLLTRHPGLLLHAAGARVRRRDQFDHDFVGEKRSNERRRRSSAEGDARCGTPPTFLESSSRTCGRGNPGALHGVSAGDVCDMAVRRGPRLPGTNNRGLDLHRLQLERAGDAHSQSSSPSTPSRGRGARSSGANRRWRQEPALAGAHRQVEIVATVAPAPSGRNSVNRPVPEVPFDRNRPLLPADRLVPDIRSGELEPGPRRHRRARSQ